jgi:hypothetical protein
MPPQSTHIVLGVAWQDADDTTRAIAMAIALQDMCPPDVDLKIDFLSCGARFEYQITDAGFKILPAQPRVKGISVAHDLGWDWPEFFGSEEIAKSLIDGQLAAFKELSLTLCSMACGLRLPLLHDFWVFERSTSCPSRCIPKRSHMASFGIFQI